MVQEFHVVRCYSCSTFQSQQVRKDKKFSCKICGAKQSVKKEYGRGSGKDCRIHVQKLNNLQRNIEAEQEQNLEAQLDEDDDDEEEECADSWVYGGPSYSQEFSEFSCEVDTGLNNQSGYKKPGNEGRSEPLSKWSTFLMSDSDDLQNQSGSASVCTERSFSFAREHGDRDILLSSSVIHNTQSDCRSVEKSNAHTTHFMRKESPSNPLVGEKQALGYRDFSNQNIGPVRTLRKYSLESQDTAERILHAGPYPGAGVSGSSRAASSLLATNPLQSFIAGFSIESENHHGKIDYQVGSVTSRQISMPLTKHSRYSKPKGTSQANDLFANEVIPDVKLDISLSKSKSMYEQNKVMGEHDAAIFNANYRVQNRVQLKCENPNMKKQHDFVSCLENKASAALRKYELSDDIDDIDFELPVPV